MKAITLSLLMLAFALPGFAQTPAGPWVRRFNRSPLPLQKRRPRRPASRPRPRNSPVAATTKIVVPADTTIPMILMNTINTKSAYVGQSIYCESIYPITVGNHIIIPKGSSIRGTVTEVIRPGHVKGRAQLGLRFDELILPNGTTRHLRATLAGFGSEGDDKFKPKEGQIEGGGSKGKDAETVARTTIPGAEIGTIVGAAKGAPLEGLGIGSAVGAATGRGLDPGHARQGYRAALRHQPGTATQPARGLSIAKKWSRPRAMTRGRDAAPGIRGAQLRSR